MLTQIRIQRYKSLFDVTINLEPLTVFIGPNGSGKSNVCEALFVLSHLIKGLSLPQIASNFLNVPNWRDKCWQGKTQNLKFSLSGVKDEIVVDKNGDVSGQHQITPSDSETLSRVVVYDFSPASIAQETANLQLIATGQGVANALTDILLDNRERFVELEQRLIQLAPHIARISLKRKGDHNLLRLVNKYSDHLLPASDISDGTLRILAFLTALYQVETPSILCFEEPENGVHPWLLHKMMEILNLVSTEGITGKPIQVLITTHSPVLLNYVKPEQVRAVEIDDEGKTQIHALPTESVRFQAALEVYDGELGELWFTNLFGGNPE